MSDSKARQHKEREELINRLSKLQALRKGPAHIELTEVNPQQVKLLSDQAEAMENYRNLLARGKANVD